MRKFALSLVLATALTAGTALTGAAQAAPGVAGQLDAAAGGINMVERTQFIFGGRNYCWYAGGWRGPGWYWCGYAWRRGYGWGGGRGWHGWHNGGRGWHGRGNFRGGHAFAHHGGGHGGGHRGGGHHH
jgi:hypothetical protein